MIAGKARFIKDPNVIWKVIPGYEHYEISEKGDVWSNKHCKILVKHSSVVLSKRLPNGDIWRGSFLTVQAYQKLQKLEPTATPVVIVDHGVAEIF